MAMNFWEAQKKARSKTSLYLTLFIALTVTVAVVVEYAMRIFAGPDYDPSFPMVGFFFLAITFGVAFFEYAMYRSQGGSYVAESVGGRLVSPHTTNLKEKQLMNIVQEIAIASSLPVPPVYIVPVNSINAFAAGITPNNAAIAVTKGTLELLSRDELQGVVAHEYGHIYNGDMKISMRLAAMVMGFFFVLYIAMRIMQFTPRASDDDKKGNPILLAALLLLAAGAITWLFGSILKAAVSREREYLADACAVQFTRNPDGISNALRKIATHEVNDMPNQGMAYSHLYFDDNTTLSFLFATHPPLKDRIAAIQGRTYIPEEWLKDLPPQKKEEPPAPNQGFRGPWGNQN
jgi:heat shock protein HtpX